MPTGTTIPETQQAKQTVAQIFAANGWELWWTNTGIQHFNARPGSNNCNDPGASEFGNDYTPSYLATIRSITSGTVIYAQKPPFFYTHDANGAGHTSIGWVVQIRSGDGSIMHYQHMASTPLKVGNNVNVGDPVGVGGGCPEGCYGANQCTCTDGASTGSHIEVRFSTKEVNGTAPWCNGNWIDPLPVITSIVGNYPTQGYSQSAIDLSLSGLAGLSAAIGKVNPLKPNSDVAQVFYDIDVTMELVPILPQYQTISIFGAQIPDPQMVYDVAYNFFQNLGALFWRFVLTAIGTYICFQVFNDVIHFTRALGQGIESGAGLARLGMAFA